MPATPPRSLRAHRPVTASRFGLRLLSLGLGVALLAAAAPAARAQTFSYWDINTLTAGAGPDATPDGTWSPFTAFWNTQPTGSGVTLPWSSQHVAVFAAGTNATGAYTVSLDTSLGAITAAALVFEEGQVTLGGTGTLSLLHPLPGVSPYLSLPGTTATIGSGVTLSSLTGLVIGGTGTLQLAGQTNVLGTTRLSQAHLTLAAAQRLSDASPVELVSGAVLDLASFPETLGGLAGDGSVLLGSATLTVASVADTAFAGSISGTGALVKTGSAALALSAAQAWTGGTSVQAGTLALGASHVFSDTAALTLGSSGTLFVGPHQDRVGTLTGTGTVSLAGGTFELGTAGSFIFGGAFTGSGTVRKHGTGLLTLGGASSQLGTFAIEAGMLRLGASQRLNDTLDLSLAAGTTFDLAGFDETLGALTGTGTVTPGGGTLTVGADGSNFTFGGSFTGTGDAAKTGAGTFTLAGTFATGGTFSIHQGSLLLPGAQRLAALTRLTLAPLGQLQLGGGDQTLAALTGSGTVLLTSGSLTLDGATDSLYLGSIGGPGTVTKRGPGQLTLAGENTFPLLLLEAGTVRLPGSSRLAATTDVALSAGTTLHLDAPDALTELTQVIGALTGTGTVVLDPTSLLGVGWDGSSFSFAGTTTGGRLFKYGTGTLTFAPGSLVQSNVSAFGGRLALATDEVIANAGSLFLDTLTTLDLAGHTETLENLDGGGTVDLGLGGALTVAPKGSQHSAFLGPITGLGALTKSGNARLTLAGPLTYSGPTTITDGTLALGASATLDTDVAVAAPGILDLLGHTLNFDQLTGTGTVQFDDGRLTVGSGGGDFTFAGSLLGATGSRFTKTGAGDLTFGGAATVAELAVAAGRLLLGGSERIANTSDLHLAPGTHFLLQGHTETLDALTGDGTAWLADDASTFTVGAGGASFTFDGLVTGAGTFRKAGAGTLTLAGPPDQPGGGSITPTLGTTLAGGVLRLALDERLGDALPVHLVDNTTFDLAGHHETVGGLSGAGDVQLSAGDTPGLLVVALAPGVSAFSGAITGHGSLTLTGTGTLAFAGKTDANQHLWIEGGTFRLDPSGHLAPTNGVTVATGATFDMAAQTQEVAELSGGGLLSFAGGLLTVHEGNFTGTLAGPGTLEKIGSGALALSGPMGFPGTLQLSEGSVHLGLNGPYSFAQVNIAPSATLSGAAGIILLGNVAHDGLLSGEVPLPEAGLTPFHLRGAVTGPGSFAGAITLGGSYSPGPGPVQITTDAQLTLSPTHTLHLELNGPARGANGHDRLHVTGSLALGGTLHVIDLGAFALEAGDAFTLFTGSPRTGAFTAYDLPALAPGLAWDTSGLGATGVLRIVSGYAAWAASFGLDLATNGAPTANPSGDGVPNLLKYLLLGDPFLSQPEILPTVTREAPPGKTPQLVIRYIRSASASATLAQEDVQTSTDLVTWNPPPMGSSINIDPVLPDDPAERADPDLQRVTVRVPATAPRLFLRLFVELPVE